MLQLLAEPLESLILWKFVHQYDRVRASGREGGCFDFLTTDHQCPQKQLIGFHHRYFVGVKGSLSDHDSGGRIFLHGRSYAVPVVLNLKFVPGPSLFVAVHSRYAKSVAAEVFGAIRIEHSKSQPTRGFRECQEAVAADARPSWRNEPSQVRKKVRVRHVRFCVYENEIIACRLRLPEGQRFHISGSK